MISSNMTSKNSLDPVLGPESSVSANNSNDAQCSEDEQINRDLLQLRRHLALLTTTPTEQSSEPEVIYAKVVKQTKNAPNLTGLFEEIPEWLSWKDNKIDVLNNKTTLPRLFCGISLNDKILKKENNILRLDTPTLQSHLICSDIFEFDSYRDSFRLASILLSDTINQLTNDSSKRNAHIYEKNQNKPSLPVILVFDEHNISAKTPNILGKSANNISIVLMLSAIKWTFARLNILSKEVNQNNFRFASNLSLSAFYITSKRQVSLIESNESSVSCSSTSLTPNTSVSSSTVPFQHLCENPNMGVSILQQCLFRLQCLISENKDEQFIFSFSIYVNKHNHLNNGQNNSSNRCALSIVKCFPAIKSDGDSLSLWRILQILSQSNRIFSSEIKLEKKNDEKNDNANDFTDKTTMLKNEQYNFRSSNPNSLSNRQSIHRTRNILSKCNIYKLFSNLVKDNSVSLSLIVNLNPSNSSLESGLFHSQWQCLHSLSQSIFLNLQLHNRDYKHKNKQQLKKLSGNGKANSRKASLSVNEQAGTASSEHSFDTVIVCNQKNRSQIKIDENSLPNESCKKDFVKIKRDKVIGNSSNQPGNVNLRNTTSNNHQSQRRSKSRRNSVYSHETTSSLETSKNRHRISNHIQRSLQLHTKGRSRKGRNRLSSGKTVQLINYGLADSTFNPATWTSEIWVDGPLATDLSYSNHTHSAKSTLKRANSSQIARKQSNNSDKNVTDNSDLDCDQRQIRIQQWIASNAHVNSGCSHRAQASAIFNIDKQQSHQIESQYHYHKPEPSTVYVTNIDGSQMAVTVGMKSAKNASIKNITGNGNVSTLIDCDTRTELTELNMAEPPKQLRLEQFLAQLSTITAKSNLTNDVTNSRMLFTEDARQQQTIIENASCLLPTEVGTNVPIMAHDSSSSESMIVAQSKLKRNTTSTTTSGHGTISEGECSSIVNQLSPAPLSILRIAENGSKRSHRQFNSSPSTSTTPGSGIDPETGPIQRQQPTTSSGYESTIQDDVDDIDELEENTSGIKRRESISVPGMVACSSAIDSRGSQRNESGLWQNDIGQNGARITCTDFKRGTILLGENNKNDFVSKTTYSKKSTQFCSFLFCCAIRK